MTSRCRRPQRALWLGLTLAVGCAACHDDAARPPKEQSNSPYQLPVTGFIGWHELMTANPEAAVAFYEAVVGWRAEWDSPDHGHATLVGDYGDVAGVTRLTEELRAQGVPSFWVGRVEVGDVDATVARARMHGGHVAVEPADRPGLRIATLQDPGFAPIEVGHASPPEQPGARGRVSEFLWDDLTAPNADAPGFYREVFDWATMEESNVGPTGKYVIAGRLGVPAMAFYTDTSLQGQDWWTPYVHVRDIDLATERAVRRGANVLVSQPVPLGRMVKLRVPQGAFFGLLEVSAGGAR